MKLVLGTLLSLGLLSCTHTEAPSVDAPVAKTPSVAVATAVSLNHYAVVHFDFDSSKVTTKAEGIMEDWYKSLSRKSAVLVIDAHTDSQGDYEYNMKLSVKRAEAVKAFLVKRGFQAENIKTNSHGESKLYNKEDTTIKAHKHNRRAKITLRLSK